MNSSFLVKRAKELNYEFNPHKAQLKRYLATYNENIFENALHEKFNQIQSHCTQEIAKGNFDDAFNNLDDEISNVYRVAKVKRNNADRVATNVVEEANANFHNLRKCIAGETEGDVDELMRVYQDSRNAISKETLANEHKKWTEAVNVND